MARNPALDLLRAVAIIAVILFHMQVFGYGDPVPALARFGWMGVDLFFVLSGYLIGSQLLKRYAEGQHPSLALFYLRRALRILPAYWAVLALYAWIPEFRETSGLRPMWQFLTFTENLLVEPLHSRAFSHAWSLCVEEHFYFLFPLLLAGMMKWRSRKAAFIVFGSILVGGMIMRGYVWVSYLAPSAVRPFTLSRGDTYMDLIYYPTYMRLDGLLAGVAVAAFQWLSPRAWVLVQDWSNVCAVAGVGLVAGAVWLLRDQREFLPVVAGFPLLAVGLASIVAGCLGQRSVLARIRVPGAKSIATVAFSLYLVHKEVLHLVKSRLLGGEEGTEGATELFIYWVAVLAAGALLYWLVERPFLQLRRRLFPESEKENG